MAASPPKIEDLQDKIAPATIREGIHRFSKEGMKHTETVEKTVLPSPEDVVTERQHKDLLDGVENFNRKSLHHAECDEKVLPQPEEMQQAIAQEKTLQIREELSQFDASKLKATTVEVKNPLPTKDDIEAEKQNK